MIRLEELTKRFPGSDELAVDSLTMDIPEGEIVVLVGPSGCGKTTTMKLINRLIEPTSGRIFLGGEDVTKTDPDRLRRRIGYVIQQIGLFPHMTIFDNIATVPRLLKWPDEKISQRVDELLDMVGMDPSRYRDRYPKELSGGQRQRVGVARALSADPPVMLMDEPFGAIDPITRERLQNEFLRIQEELRKTIVFVTHDIDEAVKIGDRIAVLRDQSVIAQYDTPVRILSDPADDYVSNFVGSGAALKRLGLAVVGDYELSAWPTGKVGAEPAELERMLHESEHDALLLLDDDNRPLRWLSPAHVGHGDAGTGQVGVRVKAVVELTATLAHALSELVTSRVGCVVVVDGRGAYRGTLDMSVIMAAAEKMRSAERERAAATGTGAPADEDEEEDEDENEDEDEVAL
ncbi:MAG: betaine/proline/choline family ABC transporter ATP-binding protein [Actinobacteria bacterium]|nr:betaine/proline/choline family ABC transporter ATP-binding protein [Actinomycetota bacterium]